MSGIAVSDWVRLLKLGRRRFRSQADYVRFQAFQAGLIIAALEAKGVRIAGKWALDLGCGDGGYSLALSAKTNRVVAVDRNIVQKARESCPGGPILWNQADASALPFRDGQFEFILCASLIEHVDNPAGLLSEIRRVLAPDGICYLSFPPFYSPVGGHHFKPYHLLGERVAMRLARRPGESYRTAWSQWGLYPRSIRQVSRLIKAAGFDVRSMSTRFLPVNFAAVPVIGEFLTWHVEFIIAKPRVTG